jgi:hypothetical protein
MSDVYIDFLDDPRPGREPGDLGEHEEWWVERQPALEKAGYMLRPRYRRGWRPSWAGTSKSYLDFEDGQPQTVSSMTCLVLLPSCVSGPSSHGCDPSV